jgi:hypothetical protein
MRNVNVVALVAGLTLCSTAARAQQVFVYPQKDQSREQQQKDEGECSTWAKQQSGVDPSAAAPPPDRRKRLEGAGGGAARGAAAGAAIGAIAGDAGKGAAIGAAGGGMAGRRRAKGAEQAGQQQTADAYGRAFAACMEGRGYTVK